MIKKEGSKYAVRSENSNKNLGKYDTKEGAKKRLRQVEYFKRIKSALK